MSGPRSFGSEVSRPLAAPLPCPILAAELPAAVGTASEDGRGGVGAAGAALAASGLPLEGHGAQLPFPRGGTLRLGRRRRARSSDRLPAAKLESGWAPHAPRLPLAQASLAPPACDRHSLMWPGGVAGATDRARRWGDAQKLPRVGGDVGTWCPPSQQHAKLGYVSGGFEHAELSPGSVCHWDSHASSRSGSWNEVIVPVGKVGLRRRVFAPFGVFPRSSGCPGRRVCQREHGENIHQAGELPRAATATCHTRQLEQQKFVLVQLWRRKSGARRGPGAPSAAAGVCGRPLPAPGASPALSEAPRPRRPDPRPPPRAAVSACASPD